MNGPLIDFDENPGSRCFQWFPRRVDEIGRNPDYSRFIEHMFFHLRAHIHLNFGAQVHRIFRVRSNVKQELGIFVYVRRVASHLMVKDYILKFAVFVLPEVPFAGNATIKTVFLIEREHLVNQIKVASFCHGVINTGDYWPELSLYYRRRNTVLYKMLIVFAHCLSTPLLFIF